VVVVAALLLRDKLLAEELVEMVGLELHHQYLVHL
jgi:hypothetical protein